MFKIALKFPNVIRNGQSKISRKKKYPSLQRINNIRKNHIPYKWSLAGPVWFTSKSSSKYDKSESSTKTCIY